MLKKFKNNCIYILIEFISTHKLKNAYLQVFCFETILIKNMKIS